MYIFKESAISVLAVMVIHRILNSGFIGEVS